MAIRMTKPWQPLNAEAIRKLPGQLGVYQLGNAAGDVVYIGFGGGRALFGIRSELEQRLAAGTAGATQFRVEINQQYSTRYQELLMVHVADHGAIPPGNVGEVLPKLGRLSPL